MLCFAILKIFYIFAAMRWPSFIKLRNILKHIAYILLKSLYFFNEFPWISSIQLLICLSKYGIAVVKMKLIKMIQIAFLLSLEKLLEQGQQISLQMLFRNSFVSIKSQYFPKILTEETNLAITLSEIYIFVYRLISLHLNFFCKLLVNSVSLLRIWK